MYMHNSVQAIYVLSSCRVLSVIDRKDQIHLGFPLKSNCLGYVLGAPLGHHSLLFIFP